MNTPDTSTPPGADLGGPTVSRGAADGVSIRTPSPGSVVLSYGRAGLDRCRAVISQYGYSATLRVQLNYHALTPSDVEAAETTIAEIVHQLLGRASGLREVNRPLFDVAPASDTEGRRT